MQHPVLKNPEQNSPKAPLPPRTNEIPKETNTRLLLRFDPWTCWFFALPSSEQPWAVLLTSKAWLDLASHRELHYPLLTGSQLSRHKCLCNPVPLNKYIFLPRAGKSPVKESWERVHLGVIAAFTTCCVSSPRTVEPRGNSLPSPSPVVLWMTRPLPSSKLQFPNQYTSINPKPYFFSKWFSTPLSGI